ncbi:MAG: T9SS type A sorting domain-containing protein, partial [Flavobacteriaceae bacterium]
EKVELFSINGKMVKQAQPKNTQIYVDDLTSGLYLLKVYHGKKHSFHRVIVE